MFSSEPNITHCSLFPIWFVFHPCSRVQSVRWATLCPLTFYMVQFSQWPKGVSVVIQVTPAVFCTFLSFFHLPLLYSFKSSLSFPIPCLPPVLPMLLPPPTHTHTCLLPYHLSSSFHIFFSSILSCPPHFSLFPYLIDSLNNSSSFIFSSSHTFISSSSPSYLPTPPHLFSTSLPTLLSLLLLHSFPSLFSSNLFFLSPLWAFSFPFFNVQYLWLSNKAAFPYLQGLCERQSTWDDWASVYVCVS